MSKPLPYLNNSIQVEDFGSGMSEALINALNKKEMVYNELGIGLTLCLEIASICDFELSFSNKNEHGVIATIHF